MLDDDELIYTRILNHNATPNEITDYIDKLQKEIEELKKYKQYSIPCYKIIAKLDILELSEELQNKWDNLYGSEAVVLAYKELLKEKVNE